MLGIQPIDPKLAGGKTRELFDRMEAKLGMLPNLFLAMANSPGVFEGFVGLRDGLDRGVLPDKLREEIALAVSESDHSQYCLAGHAAIGKTLGLSDDEIQDSRRGHSCDKKIDVALQFCRSVAENRGCVDDDTLRRVREAGYGDREIAEMSGCVVLSLFGDYFAHISRVEVDFPAVEELAAT